MSSPEATTESPVGDRSGRPDRATTRQAIIVVLVITAIAALIIIELAFTTANDSSSINGRTATSSQYFSGS
ncbi:MAG: hypothetical protein KY438_03840 [Actinobacteria bacterium]|nr:hypothetical protein [Actinomycetota bacterium]